MKILITGQNGFIGKALFNSLQQQKHQVRGTVRNKQKTQKTQKNKDILVVGNIDSTTDGKDPIGKMDNHFYICKRVFPICSRINISH